MSKSLSYFKEFKSLVENKLDKTIQISRAGHGCGYLLGEFTKLSKIRASLMWCLIAILKIMWNLHAKTI